VLDLEPIQARHKATTQGEWQAVCIGSEGYTLRVSAGPTMRENYDALGFSGKIGEVRGGRDWKELRANAEFLGHAHEDIGKMSMEIERLRELNERTYRIIDFHTGRCPLRPLSNFSGSEEHLAEYRRVLDALKDEHVARQALQGGD